MDILKPVFNQVETNTKEVGFTKTKRPELFPVKDEHMNPCSYLNSRFTNLSKRAPAESRVLREF